MEFQNFKLGGYVVKTKRDKQLEAAVVMPYKLT